ncbi:hypothetical protein K443DRAFT_84273 [Laccaria amethystina LaAM-08-1]|uniref:Uncharacterized protein n=1 Tax=Laccaria amethystina LaAM-08-1 TaxID=1095629 RepID=A0A0C9YE99_9AGAR|nr:hypothetical protein K443DRAFT_84273 [Laccaria amethystina LaAM-08-1]
MFEEICLVCGKHLQEDGRAYCSDGCENSDLTSPSVSSSSSALSSPQFGFAAGGDVPALIPSALGSAALKKYQGRDFYDISSSSASSTSWSVVTDDDEDDVALGLRGDYSYHGSTDSFHVGSSKSANFVYSIYSSGLSYTRRPSGTNNRSTVPHLHRRLFSDGSSSGHAQSPRSPPAHSSHSSSDDEESFSDSGISSQWLDQDENDIPSEKGWIDAKLKTNSARSHNRSSLPAYFSLLQMVSPSSTKEIKLSPISSSSCNTIARPSPPTPKATLGSALALRTAGSAPMPSILATPRGRRRNPEKSKSSRRSGRSSRSPSRSRARRAIPRSPEERVVDWTAALPRGREAACRNSSPPAKMFLLEDSVRALVAMRDADILERSKSRNRTQPKTRGRARVEELDRVGSFADAPGYGSGRSGLVSRERALASHSMRVPL